MPRTLLVDTNRAVYPVYQALCVWGHEVWVVGSRPHETLAKIAAKYVQLDYSDAVALDVFIEEHAFDYLVPGCTDLSYQVCAEINRGRFPGIDTPAATLTINNKEKFRSLATDLGLSVPRILTQQEAVGAEAVIVKPVDSFSGRGMTVLRKASSTTLAGAYGNACRASKTGKAIIEECETGQLYSHSAFIVNSEIVADFVVQENCTTNPFTVDTSRVAVNFPRGLLDSLRRDATRLVSSLDLTNGLMHTQFIARGADYWIIEVTRRCPGDLYSLLIEFSTGYPYAESYAAPFIGETPVLRETDTFRERIIRHTVTSKEGAKLWGFRLAHPVDVRLFVPLATSGDSIGPSPYGRAGIFFFGTSSDSEQETLYQELLAASLYSFC